MTNEKIGYSGNYLKPTHQSKESKNQVWLYTVSLAAIYCFHMEALKISNTVPWFFLWPTTLTLLTVWQNFLDHADADGYHSSCYTNSMLSGNSKQSSFICRAAGTGDVHANRHFLWAPAGKPSSGRKGWCWLHTRKAPQRLLCSFYVSWRALGIHEILHRSEEPQKPLCSYI